MAPPQVPRAPCGHRFSSRPLPGHLRTLPPAPPRAGAYSSRPKLRALLRTPNPSTSRGCPLWCREQQRRNPLCPRHDLHTAALCRLHRVGMGCRCPTLFDLARCACGGTGGGGSLLVTAYGLLPACLSTSVSAPEAASPAIALVRGGHGGGGDDDRGGGGASKSPRGLAVPPPSLPRCGPKLPPV